MLSDASAAEAIRAIVDSRKPGMIARFGSTEIKAVLWPRFPWPLRQLTERRIVSTIHIFSGFFPPDPAEVRKFSALTYEDMQEVDILGSWRREELFLRRHLTNAKKVRLRTLEPYLSDQPWSEALEGKRVLVIHPFSDTIGRQYSRHRERLFADRRVLPRFASLATIKAVQTLAGTKSQYSTWFEALQSMKDAMDATEYDVAIIGCGAYGFSLAAHAKRSGKQAVHLGGATQILFGIRGNRWDGFPWISALYNQYWVRPAAEEKVSGADRIENACYW